MYICCAHVFVCSKLFLFSNLSLFLRHSLQDSVFIMMPANRVGYGSNGEYYPLELMIIVMFLFQLIRVGYVLRGQCTCDIFLIDWEKVSVGNFRALEACV